MSDPRILDLVRIVPSPKYSVLFYSILFHDHCHCHFLSASSKKKFLSEIAAVRERMNFFDFLDVLRCF